MTLPIISDDRRVQAAYVRMRREGQSHSMAEMLALRKVPTLRTGATMLAGRKAPFGEERNMHTDRVCGTAKRHGLDPNNYCPTLADYPGDPKAFLPNDDPAGHVKKLKRRLDEKVARAIDKE
jgi:hypothetical protein